MPNPFSSLTSVLPHGISEGLNKGVQIAFKLHSEVIRTQDNLARYWNSKQRTFIASSGSSNIAVSFYNIVPGSIKVGSVIIVAHPYCSAVGDTLVICADELLCIAIDGKRVNSKMTQLCEIGAAK